MNFLYFIYLPFAAGLLCLLVPRKIKYLQGIIAMLGSTLFLLISIRNMSLPDQSITIPWFDISFIDFSFQFRWYHFPKFLVLFFGIFSVLTALYSLQYYSKKKISHLFFPFFMFTLAGASTVVLADNFFVLLLGWELVTLFLFYLIAMGEGKPASMIAGKTFAILGFTDVALLFGIVGIRIVYDTWQISALSIQVGDTLSTTVYLLLFIAAVAKAGAMPFHSWIPETSEKAPLPMVAYLPASMDKLIGIYFLARINLDVFTLNQSMLLIMLIMGAITIIFANLMALVQNDLKKFLGFATITQVGYMLIGFGSGTIVGIIGGLFHMLNHAIYKILLFFGAGVIERETGTTDMNKLGGLAKTMPVTFILITIGIMSASGIPPFNAFVSKWMIYESVLEAHKPIFLIIAMFGSALTLATFLKMWFGVFLGLPTPQTNKKIKDGTNLYKFVLGVPAILCLLFGVFAQYPINKFIAPIIKVNPLSYTSSINFGTAFYNPTLATFLLIIGLLLGLILFIISRFPIRTVDTLFIGGENFEVGNERFLADHFYESLQKIKVIGPALQEGQKGVFDLYNLSSSIGLLLVNILKKMHDGVLSTYLAWCVIGLGIICFLLMVF